MQRGFWCWRRLEIGPGAGIELEPATYRAVYTVALEGCLYVLHCFQKKSKKGAETPTPDLELIETRLKAARALHATRQRKK